jgi:hypothetical protein
MSFARSQMARHPALGHCQRRLQYLRANMMKKVQFYFGVLAIALFVTLMSTGTMFGQSVASSQVSGRVQDSTGALVSNAQIQLTQAETGQIHKVVSSTSGSFIIPDLPSGTYTLQVTNAGFETYVQRGIVLQVGSSPEIIVTMTVGEVSQQVVVEAVNASVEFQSTGIGQVINSTQLVELPLNGRDPDQLIALAGATTTAVGGDLNSNKNFPTIAISVAGGLPNGVAFVLDGATHNEPTNNLNMPQPVPDALQEFKVETSSLPAQYGNHAAAAINAVTKSGTNKYHGDAFEFIRNYALNALGFFGSYATSPYKDGLKRNQFGGTLGGPIKKDKVFFFGGYQGTILRSTPLPTYTQVPTVQMMAGDFSTVTSTACNKTGITLNAPYFASVNGVPNQFVGGPGAFSPQAVAAMKYIPIAGTTGNPDQTFLGSKGLYTANCGYVAVKFAQNQRQNSAVGRVDWILSDKNRAFGRYFLGINNQPIVPTQNNALTENAVNQYNRDQGITLGDTYSLTQNVINSLRLSANRVVNLRVVQPFFDPATLGVNTYNAIPGYTALSVTGGFGVGGGTTNPGHFNSTELELVDDVGWIKGNHQFSFGVDYIYAIMATVNNRPANGVFAFAGTTTSSNKSYGYASFFAGALDTFSQGLPDLENDGQTTFGVYAQDSWKILKNLTVNYGLRWEPYLPEHNSNDHVENFNMAAFNAGTKSSVYVNAPAGLLFDGDPGQPGNHYTFGNKAIFEPRVGLIWDPFGDGKTSVRAGYGMFYDTPQMFFNTRYSNQSPYGSTLSPGGGTFANPWLNYPTAGANQDPFPGLNALSKTIAFGQGGVFVNSPLHIQPFYLEQWNLSVQRQIGTWLVGATYLGNRSVHLPTSYEADPALFVAGTCTAGQYGLTAAGACSNTTTANYNARRLLYMKNPSQGISYSTIGQYDDEGIADYNGVLVSVQRRAKLMTISANYTYAHCLSEAETTELTGPSYADPPSYDADGRRRSYSNCDSDRRQVLNAPLILNAPRWQNHVADMLASNWSLSVIFTATTGGFSSVTTGQDITLAGTGNTIATNPAHPYGTRTNFGTQNYLVQQTLGTGSNFPAQCLTATWSCPAAGSYSTQRPLSLVGPSSYELDMSLGRTFNIPHMEGQKLQFRWEVFNVPNEVILNGIGGATASGTAVMGNFTTSGAPRIMQAALKYIF